jgi:hypothetical protein
VTVARDGIAQRLGRILMTSLTLGALGYLFEISSHPELSVIAFARKIVAYQWLT